MTRQAPGGADERLAAGRIAALRRFLEHGVTRPGEESGKLNRFLVGQEHRRHPTAGIEAQRVLQVCGQSTDAAFRAKPLEPRAVPVAGGASDRAEELFAALDVGGGRRAAPEFLASR